MKMVITLCKSNIDGRIEGILRVYERDANGNLAEKQTEVRKSACFYERKSGTYEINRATVNIPSACK